MPSLVTTLVALLAAAQAPSYAEGRVGGCDLERMGLTRPVASLTAGTPSGSSYTYGETASDPSSQYNGRVYDPGTGFHDYGARMYWPQIGRFVSADSYRGNPANPASLNLYSYVHNNPYKYVDPTGHDAASVTGHFFLGAGKEWVRGVMMIPCGVYCMAYDSYQEVQGIAQLAKDPRARSAASPPRGGPRSRAAQQSTWLEAPLPVRWRRRKGHPRYPHSRQRTLLASTRSCPPPPERRSSRILRMAPSRSGLRCPGECQGPRLSMRRP